MTIDHAFNILDLAAKYAGVALLVVIALYLRRVVRIQKLVPLVAIWRAIGQQSVKKPPLLNEPAPKPGLFADRTEAIFKNTAATPEPPKMNQPRTASRKLEVDPDWESKGRPQSAD